MMLYMPFHSLISKWLIANYGDKRGVQMLLILQTIANVGYIALYHLVGCLFYYFYEGMGPSEAMQFITVSITCVGYGKYLLDDGTKIFSIFYITIGLIYVSTVVRSITAALLHNRLNDYLLGLQYASKERFCWKVTFYGSTLAALCILGSIFYNFNEPAFSWTDAWWMVFQTVTSIGYGSAGINLQSSWTFTLFYIWISCIYAIDAYYSVRTSYKDIQMDQYRTFLFNKLDNSVVLTHDLQKGSNESDVNSYKQDTHPKYKRSPWFHNLSRVFDVFSIVDYRTSHVFRFNETVRIQPSEPSSSLPSSSLLGFHGPGSRPSYVSHSSQMGRSNDNPSNCSTNMPPPTEGAKSTDRANTVMRPFGDDDSASQVNASNNNNSKVELSVRSSHLTLPAGDDCSHTGTFVTAATTTSMVTGRVRASVAPSVTGQNRMEVGYVTDLINDWRDMPEGEFIIKFLLALKTVDVNRDILPLQEFYRAHQQSRGLVAASDCAQAAVSSPQRPINHSTGDLSFASGQRSSALSANSFLKEHLVHADDLVEHVSTI